MNNYGMIIVGMADMNTSRSPGILTTIGLGSCVGVALYDPLTKVAGLAHIMLPDSSLIKNNVNKAKFADTAVIKLVNDMTLMGARRTCIVAKIAGGAQMFSITGNNESMKIGERNVEAVTKILRKLNIPIVASDTGKNYGRTVELYSQDGRLVVKTVGHGIITL
jgi:chemotaxis protein CheD